jgi:FAD/FMN-containing dehydrogenase
LSRSAGGRGAGRIRLTSQDRGDPGYPAITVGGCIAANVHGKDPVRDGTLVDSVQGVTLFHPAHGVLRSSPGTGPDVFALTCRGYGLTGVIVCASLRLEAQAGSAGSIRRPAAGSAAEALPLVHELAGVVLRRAPQTLVQAAEALRAPR